MGQKSEQVQKNIWMIGLRRLDGWISYWLWVRQEGGVSQGRMDFWLNSGVSDTNPQHNKFRQSDSSLTHAEFLRSLRNLKWRY